MSPPPPDTGSRHASDAAPLTGAAAGPDLGGSPTVAGALSRAPDAVRPVESRHLPRWLAPVFLVVLSLAVYWPTRTYELVYDDAFLITANTSMQPAKTSLLGAFTLFGREYWDGVNADNPESLRLRGQALYRPLTLFAWAVIVNLAGVGATGAFHLMSILCNAAVVLLLYLLVRRLWRSGRLAFLATLLFALHPLHSEAVAYVAGVSDVVSAAAVLGGLLLWERATREEDRLQLGAYAGLLATLFVGLLAKEQAVVLIAAVALTDLMCAWRGERRGGVPRMAVYAGMLMVLTSHILIRWAAMGYIRPNPKAISPMDNPLISEPFLVRFLTGAKVLAMQVWLFLWPRELSVDYSFNAIPVARAWSEPEAAAGIALVLLLLVYGLVMLRRRPALGWGVLFFLGCAVFTSSILVPIGTIFGERLMYLSSAGACLAVAAVLDPLLRDRRAPSVEAGGVSALGLLVVLSAGGALGVRTWERNQDFRTSQDLFTAALKVVPESARVQFQLASLYFQQKLYTAAEERYETSLKIDNTFIQGAIGLGDTYTASKNWAKAITTYDRILDTIALTPTGTSEALGEIQRLVYMRRAGAKAGAGDLDGAAADLRLATQVRGSGDLGGVTPYLQLAQLNFDAGKPAEAIPILKQALQLDPQNLNALYLLARAAFVVDDQESLAMSLDALEQTEKGRPMALAMKAERIYNEAAEANDDKLRQQAIDMFEEVRESAPTLATPYVFRARFFFEKGRYADAILETDRALERAPRHPIALLLKAMSQNAANRPAEALATTQELVVIKPDVPCYTAMATAHAMLGDVDALEADYLKLKELGSQPVEIILTRAIVLQEAGRLDDAISAVEQGRLIAEFRQEPRMLRTLGVLLLDAGRWDEALDMFQQQDIAERSDPNLATDAFLSVNRARALAGLGRDLEAAAQLELFESTITPDSTGWPSLLHRRAELFLRRGGPLYDPAAAAKLCDEGLLITKNRYPALLDVSIEALVAKGDLPGAVARAQLARTEFPEVKRYQLAEEALTAAQAGDRAGAANRLRKANDAVLARIADALPSA